MAAEDLKILIADNSPMYKKMFTQAIMELDKNATVISVSKTEDALESIKHHDFDAVIADAEISGLETSKFIKDIAREIPKALVLITARPAIAKSGLFAETLTKGTIDHMIKPLHNSYNENFDVIKNKIADILKILLDERKKKNSQYTAEPVSALNLKPEDEPLKTKKIIRKSKFRPEIVLIAASTGGPAALKTVLSQLSADFPVPILIVQHMPPHFTETMTNHLNQNSKVKVKIAESRESIESGIVYTAPGGIHMKLDDKNKIYFDGSPPINGVRPSADALFESVAESFSGTGVLAVVLTGMGSDGQKGIEKLKEKRDCFCLVQSEKTCVVYGMPRSVAESGLADKIVDLEDIPGEIESFNYNYDSKK